MPGAAAVRFATAPTRSRHWAGSHLPPLTSYIGRSVSREAVVVVGGRLKVPSMPTQSFVVSICSRSSVGVRSPSQTLGGLDDRFRAS